MAEGKVKTRRRRIAGAIVLIILILALLFRLTTRMTPPGGTEELENLPQRSLIDSQPLSWDSGMVPWPVN